MKFLSFGLLAAALALGGATSCSARSNEAAARPATPPPAGAPTVAGPTVLPSPALARVGAGAANIADVVEKVVPSVVSVWSTRVQRAPVGWPFGPGSVRQEGLGSGVVIAPGIVVTNNHVVADATELKVTTTDRHEFTAEVIGTDPKSDVAVLKLKGDTSKLVPIPLGDSSRLRLGDVVLAVGNPFGLGQTVTMGIVSAKGRANMGIVDYEDFIQTDAAINPGNSGGALVDMEGKLVGINTAILSRTGGNVGIGFAIPTNMAKPIIQSLQQNGRVVRGWLGVSIRDVDDRMAAKMHLPAVSGVLVADVQPQTPADRAGLRRGDIITKLAGQTVESAGQFRNTIAAKGGGTRISIELLRDGKPVQVEAALAEQPAEPAAAQGPPEEMVPLPMR